MSLEYKCDTCGVQVYPPECVVFTSHLGTEVIHLDITGCRCYPCEDRIVDAFLVTEVRG